VSGDWIQQAYLKASDPGGATPSDIGDFFGISVAISGDTIVIGAPEEDSDAIGVNGDPFNDNNPDSGAAYVFVRNGTTWTPQAYLKASNPGEFGDQFGNAVAISGETIVVGAFCEWSRSTGVNGVITNMDDYCSGAAYVFVRRGTNWSQEAYMKASNSSFDWFFGRAVAISGDTIVVGANGEPSSAIAVNGEQHDRSWYTRGGASSSYVGCGAAYAFVRDGTTRRQQAYLKRWYTNSSVNFGWSVAVAGTTAVVGASEENRDQTVNPIGEASVFVGLGHGPRLDVVPDDDFVHAIRLQGAPETAYPLQRASDPAGPWETVTTLTTGTSGTVSFHEPTPLPGASFYRVVMP